MSAALNLNLTNAEYSRKTETLHVHGDALHGTRSIRTTREPGCQIHRAANKVLLAAIAEGCLLLA